MGRTVTSKDIEELRALLSGTNAKLLTPTEEGYEKAIERWSKAAEKPAGVVVVPTDAFQISTVVKFAAAKKLDLAVRGGGHSTAGSSSTDGGLLFDLSSIRDIIVDPATKTVKVGGGANWGEVDAGLAKYGLATVGGTISDTGVGGLTLGGGYGWLSGKYGLTIDNLISVTVVVASGDILKASKDQNPDLFWAMRGAGHNFGLVTEFEFQAFEQGDMWAGVLAFKPAPPVVAQVVAAVNDIFVGPKDGKGTTKLAGQGMGALVLTRPPDAGGKVVLAVAIIFNGTEEEGKKAFKALFDIGPINSTMKPVPYHVANQTLHGPHGYRVSMKGAVFSLPLQPEFVQEVLGEYVKFTEEAADMAGTMIIYELYDPYVVNTRASNQDTSFANRGWHMNAMVTPYWTKPENDALGRQWARDTSVIFDKWFAKSGREQRAGDYGTVLAYGNYDHYDGKKSQDLFGLNYPRLQSVKAKYDPGNLFNKQFAVTPQL
ncbi:FAD binding domain-containing protein [Cadophora sp. MPI-SDFR-AT-0126]|nr:FAD binding domain-containing protein [Leotiomycetes sp. MPI-SDFR-AT-0126]